MRADIVVRAGQSDHDVPLGDQPDGPPIVDHHHRPDAVLDQQLQQLRHSGIR